MTTRRTAKVAEAIRQVVSSAILFEMRDPRVKNITVLRAEVPTDLRTAKIYVSVMGDEKDHRLSLQGLESARGWLQSRIADELQLRLTPILTFIMDPGVKKSIEVSRLLRELDLPSAEAEHAESDSDEDEHLENQTGEEEELPDR
jgi:ribosome-binding factor A